MWNKEDIDFLVNNYSKMSNYEIGNALNRTKKAVDSKAIKLGLKKDNTYVSNINKNRVIDRWGANIWTKEDLDFLTLNLDKMSNSELSIRLNKSIDAIVSKSVLLGLKRTPIYTKEYIQEECLKYSTKQEFNMINPNLCAWLYKKGLMSEYSKHMMSVSYSTPQLILNYILKKLLGDKAIYNDRKTIKPFEIDIYFPEHKLGFEYDGSYYHSDKDSSIKINLCKDKGICLIVIDEESLDKKGFDSYVSNINKKIIDNLDLINSRTSTSITKNEVLSIEIDKKDIFKGLYNVDKLNKICQNYTDYSKFIKERKDVYNKIYYLGLLKDFTKHMKVDNKNNENMKYIIESKKYYRINDKIKIEYWYNGMITTCLITDIIGNRYKISHNIPESLIFNAPDEIVKSSDIIDKKK